MARGRADRPRRCDFIMRNFEEIDTPGGRRRFPGSGFEFAHGGGRLDSMAPDLSAHRPNPASIGVSA